MSNQENSPFRFIRPAVLFLVTAAVMFVIYIEGLAAYGVIKMMDHHNNASSTIDDSEPFDWDTFLQGMGLAPGGVTYQLPDGTQVPAYPVRNDETVQTVTVDAGSSVWHEIEMRSYIYRPDLSLAERDQDVAWSVLVLAADMPGVDLDHVPAGFTFYLGSEGDIPSGWNAQAQHLN
jgi:hypothetical protein